MAKKKKYYIRNHHEAIVSPELWKKAQEVKKKRTINQTTGHTSNCATRYTFSSKICCGFCGTNYIRKSASKKKDGTYTRYWACLQKQYDSKSCEDSLWIREEILEGVFVELYNSIVKNKYMTNLLDLRLDGTINKEVYLNKEKELNEKIENIKKEKLLILEQQNDQTERKIKEIEKIVLEPNVIKEFDGDIFESMIEKIIIGRINEKKRKRAKCYKIHLKNRRKL